MSIEAIHHVLFGFHIDQNLINMKTHSDELEGTSDYSIVMDITSNVPSYAGEILATSNFDNSPIPEPSISQETLSKIKQEFDIPDHINPMLLAITIYS